MTHVKHSTGAGKGRRRCSFCKEVYPAEYPNQFHREDKCIDSMWKAANEKLKQQAERDRKSKKKAMKLSVKTSKDYIKELQKEINSIVRCIDKGWECISSNRPWKSTDQAGHYKSTGSHPSIRFHLLNNFSQSVADNMYKSGNLIGYTERLKSVFGNDIYTEIEGLSLKYSVIKLTNEELVTATKKARSIVKHLKQEDKCYTLEQRIELRRKYNKDIGIYTN